MNAARISCRARGSGLVWRPLALAFLVSHLGLTFCQAAGTVSAWGNNNDSQCQTPPGLANVVAVAAGNIHSLALKSDGTVVGWGFNLFGQATPPPGLTNVTAISAGNSYSLALKNDGTVTQWGNQTAPPAGLTNVTAIAAGWDHTLALQRDGTVVAWGSQSSPAGLSNVVAIAAGNGHSLALLSDRTVLAWGDNAYGKTNVPAGLTNVAAIAAGKDHSLALKWDGTVVAWGGNYDGQTNVPSGLTNVIAIAGGGLHSLALKGDGTLAAWGDNNYGQSVVNPAADGFVAVSGGGTHSLAIHGDGTPVILVSPASQTVTISKNGSFQAMATGFAPLSYHWQRDTTNALAGTASTLVLNNVQLGDAGAYTVVVTNAFGVVTSSIAILTVVGAPPVVTVQPQPATTICGDGATFTVTADGSAPFSYQWQFEGTAIANATTTRLRLTNVSTSGGGNYMAVVTNAFGSVTSAPALLTVTVSPPSITSSLTKAGKQGRAFSYRITALHSPISFAADGLPLGLAINPATGIISGTNLENGAFGPTITAFNACSSDTKTLLLTITSSVPMITSSLTASGTEQLPFNYQITATDTPTGFDAQSLPLGLTLDPATGIISGNPLYAGDFYSTISASNVWGTGSATLHFTFDNAPVNGLSIDNVSPAYSSPYLLDFQFTLKDNTDPTMGHAIITNPRFLSAVAMEDGVPVSPSETAVIIARGTSKQFKSFLVLDFTESIASLSNGDTNGDGISDAVDAIVAGAQNFVNHQPPDAQVGVYEFHREDMAPNRVASLTNDHVYLDQQIGGIWTNYVQNFPASSRAWDATVAAITNFSPILPPDEQHYVILVSDGKDESSFSTPADVITAATNAGVNVYCIGFGNELDPTSLQAITSATGGRYYDGPTVGLTAAFDQIIKDLQGQYLLRWATLKRSTNSFIPSFQITYQGQTAPSPASPYTPAITNIDNTTTPPTTNITPAITNFIISPYTPSQHTGNVTVGSVRLLANSVAQPETITLRASYVPRYIRQIRIHYRANWPATPTLQSTNIGEILYGWSLNETNDGAGGKWLQLLSPNPQSLTNSIQFAALGNLVSFAFRDMINPSNAFALFAIDNTIYASTGGQSFSLTNNPFLTNYPALPFGTPIPWLISYGYSASGPSNVWALAELADPDGDGVPNWMEYRANTNPTNAASKFVARSITKALDGRYQVTFSTALNRTYRLESSSDLLSWQIALDNIAGTGADVTITDTRYLPGARIFYRVAVY